MSRAMRIVFTLSLAFNLLFLAFAGTVAWRLRHGPLGVVDAAAARGLNAADTALMRETLAANIPSYNAALARMSAAHRRVDAALRAQPFDPAALHQAMQDWRASMDGFLGSFLTPLETGADQISPAGRAALAARGDIAAARSAHVRFGP